MFIVKIDSSVGAQRSFCDFLILTEKTALTLAFFPPLVAASDVIDVNIVLCFLISHGSMDNWLVPLAKIPRRLTASRDNPFARMVQRCFSLVVRFTYHLEFCLSFQGDRKHLARQLDEIYIVVRNRLVSQRCW